MRKGLEAHIDALTVLRVECLAGVHQGLHVGKGRDSEDEARNEIGRDSECEYVGVRVREIEKANGSCVATISALVHIGTKSGYDCPRAGVNFTFSTESGRPDI